MIGIEQLKRRIDALKPGDEDTKVVFFETPSAEYPTLAEAETAADQMKKANKNIIPIVWHAVDSSGQVPDSDHAIVIDAADRDL